MKTELAAAFEDVLASDPERRALLFEGRWHDWRWMRATADSVDAAIARAGLSPEAPVGFIANNRPVDSAALLAVLRSGRSIVMIYPIQSSEGIAGDVAALRLEAVIADEAVWTAEVREAARATGTAAIMLSESEAGGASLAAEADRVGPGPHRGPLEKPGIEMLTSGTTGKPKRHALDYAVIYRSMIKETITRGDADFPAEDEMPAFLAYPYGNISGLYTFLPAAAARRPVMLLRKFDIDAWIDLVRTYRPTDISLPPAGVKMVLERNPPPEDLSSLKAIISGTAHIDEKLHREFEERYGCYIVPGFGATEFGGPVANMTPALRDEFGDSKIGSVGRAWAGAQLRIVDPDTGEVLPVGKEGLLEVIAPRIGPDWIRTTDLAMLDSDGFLWHKGRADGAISRGGFKILPDTVVEGLLKHPSVGEAAVVGVPDEKLGQVPVAAVELLSDKPPATVEELEEHARRVLFKTHIPVRILIVDQLPRTPSLKVSLPQVKALFSAG